MTQQQSNVIRNLRFPLIIGVVLIHCRVTNSFDAWNNGLQITSAVLDICTRFFTSPCVPLFFFFSGFLFFANSKTDQGLIFNLGGYFCKIRKRVRTLLVPYLFWNSLILLFFAFLHKFTPELISPDNNNVYNYTFLDFLRSFWDFPDNMPVNYPFWYLRDLMIMVVFSPIVFIIAKYGKWCIPVIVLLLWIYSPNILPDSIPGYSAISFFTLGASFSINDWDFTAMASKVWKYLLPIWLSVICVFICVHETKLTEVASPVLCLMGMVVYLALASFIRSGASVSFLTSSSFFIYAFHGIPIRFIINVMISVFRPTNDTMWVLTFVICFLSVVVLSLMFYCIMSKCLPKFTTVITGGR